MTERVFSSCKKFCEEKISQFLLKTIWLKKQMSPIKLFLLSVYYQQSNFQFEAFNLSYDHLIQWCSLFTCQAWGL